VLHDFFVSRHERCRRSPTLVGVVRIVPEEVARAELKSLVGPKRKGAP
jgi:hypothetical protein